MLGGRGGCAPHPSLAARAVTTQARPSRLGMGPRVPYSTTTQPSLGEPACVLLAEKAHEKPDPLGKAGRLDAKLP